MNFKTPKGTKDILPSESYIWQYIEEKARTVFNNANYQEIRTPVFETTELFTRGVGDSTDIVNKEMYTFIQKERSLTLRPENTAGVVRAFIEHGMHRLSSPIKLWYKGPMFRYERPQAGRYREFYQCDVDTVGVDSPAADAEVVACANSALKAIGIEKFTFRINSRKLMNELLTDAGVPKNQIVRTLRILDKLDKLSKDEIAKELRAFLSEESTNELLELMKLSGDWYKISKTIKVCDDTKKVIEEFLNYLKSLKLGIRKPLNHLEK